MANKKIVYFRQSGVADCGLTCLRMIAATHNKNVSMQQLRKIVPVYKNGTNFFVLQQAAEKIGFDAASLELKFNELQNIPLPAILHWNKNHFVVLYDIKQKAGQNKFFIADPAIGLIELDESAFKENWVVGDNKINGLAIAIVPNNNFIEQIESPSFEDNTAKWKKIFSYLLEQKKKVIVIFLLLLASNLLLMLLPRLTQELVDNGIANKNILIIYYILLGQFFIMVGKFFIDFFYQRLLLSISIRINKRVLSDFILKLIRLPMSFYESKSTGDILQRIEDQYRIESFLTGNSVNVALSISLFIFYSVLLASYNVRYFLITAVFSIAYIVWIKYFLKKRKVLNQQQFQTSGSNQGQLIEMIQGMQEIKLNGNSSYIFNQWQSSQNQIFSIQEKFLNLRLFEQIGTFLLRDVKNLIITLMAAIAVVDQNSTLGAMIAIQFILGQISGPIEQFIYLFQDSQDALLAFERMEEIQEIEDEDSGDQENLDSLKMNGDIVLKNVSFAYKGMEKNVLENINITVPVNKITAIVGSSGSGKTTLLKLLLKYYLPDTGSITVNENNLSDFSHKNWRAQFGTVMQDGYIFNDTLGRNIATINDDPIIENLNNASKMAAMDTFLDDLPNGYNTMIGEEGMNLSKGQRQRILIARAIYKNPNILIFDEATNSLDATNEKKITDNMNEFFTNKTVIIVAHRLSTIVNADNILVMEKGKIIEQGDHKQLIQLKGAYFELIRNQLELGE
jgi:ATP-binding cassette, subfamily B, bacterial